MPVKLLKVNAACILKARECTRASTAGGVFAVLLTQHGIIAHQSVCLRTHAVLMMIA